MLFFIFLEIFSSVLAGPPAKIKASSLPFCPKSSVSTLDRIEAIWAHNGLRSAVSKGKFKDFLGQTLPHAADMSGLKYDCALEKSATRWASQCIFRQSGTVGVGENLYLGVNNGLPEGFVKMATEAWRKELKSTIWDGPRLTQELYDSGLRNATQMLWSTTRRFGCGVAQCGNKEVMVVCHYAPQGNIVDADIYKVGKTCSSCKKDCHRPSGLCFMN